MDYKNSVKKLLALLVAFAMMFSLLPSIPVMAEGEAVPVIAKYEMEGAESKLIDTSGNGYDGGINSPGYLTSDNGRPNGGQAFYPNDNNGYVRSTGFLNKAGGSYLTLSAWVRPEKLDDYMPIVEKRNSIFVGSAFQMGITPDRKVRFFGSYGGGNYDFLSKASSDIDIGKWVHVAVAFEKDVGIRFYINGVGMGSEDKSKTKFSLLPNEIIMTIGTGWIPRPFSYYTDMKRFYGLIDSLHIYAAPLTDTQIVQDMNNTLATRAPQDSDFPSVWKYFKAKLTRYDMPRGMVTTENNTYYQPAVRVNGPDAVDWPTITMDIVQSDGSKKPETPFISGSEYEAEVILQQGANSYPVSQQLYDNVVEPGNHWFRGLNWFYGQSYIYTADHSAKSWDTSYELFTFPVKIAGTENGSVKNVVLKYNGSKIYSSGSNVYNSLTLLLPQNEAGKQYELWVDGRGPLIFDAGLMPIVPGDPKDIPYKIDLTVPGQGPSITVKSLERSEQFPNQKEWEKDVSALSAIKPSMPSYNHGNSSIKEHLGIDVPRSPVSIYFSMMPHGMGLGSYYERGDSRYANSFKDSGGTLKEYVDMVSDIGYDEVSEWTKQNQFTDTSTMHESMAIELAKKGIQYRLSSLVDWGRPFLAQPNVAFLSHNLPDFHGTLYRDIQLETQRMNKYPNLAGVTVGADNGNYESFWAWAPPIPNRPWGEAFEIFQKAAGKPNNIPLAPSLKGNYTPYSYEYFGDNQKDFVDYIKRYNDTYRQYGYFAKAVSEVDEKLSFTTGSYGSMPGGEARGGYTRSSTPGKEMHEGLTVQTTYNWNEHETTKPMHTEFLVDTLRSYDPYKVTRATVDDYQYHLDGTDREKVYASALTRGIQALGNNAVPNLEGSFAHPEVIPGQKEMYAWIKKYGGAYAMTEPTPSIGILFVQEEAVLKGSLGGENPSDDALINKGSHEGKAAEALFFTHAAGWPSKIITTEELKRGLPSSIKSILLVGLKDYDNTWHWHDGLKDKLQEFIDNGGLIIQDNESDCPVSSINPGMDVRAYVPQSHTDQTNNLLGRNADNIEKLKAAMQGIETPLAVSDRQNMWAIPTESGDTQYVTVLNQNHNASGDTRRLAGQVGNLTWNTERPIYDVRLGRKITQEEAGVSDLTQHGFNWYALPPAEVVTPSIAFIKNGSDGHYEADVSISNPDPMTGIPLEITVTHTVSGDTAIIYSATGLTAKLPLADTDPAGTYTVVVKELLTGLSSSTTVDIAHPGSGSSQVVKTYRAEDIKRFAQRTDVPVTIALTAAQKNDPQIVEQANRLVSYYLSKGRSAKLGFAEPNETVLSLQEYKTTMRYPQWKTVDEDIVLIGNSGNNVLLLDQARGGILPEQGLKSSSNIAYNRPVQVSSQENTTDVASRAVDGNPYTKWISEHTDNEWIYVDLGSTKAVKRVVLNWNNAPYATFAKSYKIQVSTDAVNWTDVYSSTSGGSKQDVTFTATDARYVRIYCTLRNNTSIGYGLLDFEVYSPDVPTLSLGKAAISYANSAFVAERDVVNIIANEATGLTAAVDYIINNDQVRPASPELLTATKTGLDAIDLKWTCAEGAKGYKVERQKMGEAAWIEIGEVSGTAFTDTGLEQNTYYTYRVYAYNDAGSSDASRNIRVKTLKPLKDITSPTKPTNLILTQNGCTAFDIAWTASRDNGGVVEYEIYNGDSLAGTTVNETVYSIKGLKPVTTYSITIKARDGAGNISEPSDALVVTTEPDTEAPNAPEYLAVASKTSTSLVLTWSEASDNVGIAGYDIYKSLELIGSTAGETDYAITGLSPDTEYSFMVKARDEAGNISIESMSLNVRMGSDKEAPTAPTGLSSPTNTLKSVYLTWEEASDNVGVEAYDIYRDGVFAGSTKGVAFTVTNLIPNKTYTFTVKARDGAGNISAASESAIVTTDMIQLYEAENASLSQGAVIAEDGKASGGKMVSGMEKKGASISINGIDGGAKNSGKSKKNTQILKVTYSTFEKNAALDLYVNGKKEDTIKLHKLNGVGNIRKGFKEVSVPVVMDTGTNNTIELINSKGCAEEIKIDKLMVVGGTVVDNKAPSTPTGLTAQEVGGTFVDLSWTASIDNAGVVGYDVYCGDKLIGVTAGEVAYKVMGLDLSTRYEFAVRAKDAAGNISAASETLSVTTAADTGAPSAPRNLTVTSKTDTSVTLSWTAASDNTAVAAYEIYKDGELEHTVTGATMYTVEDLARETVFTFIVKAKDAAQNVSEASNEVTVKTLPDTEPPTIPAGLKIISRDCTYIEIAWDASTDNAGVTAYDVYINEVLKASTGGLTTTYRATGLKPGTEYTFTVKAKDAKDNTSSSSEALAAATKPDTEAPTVPAGLTVVSKSCNMVELSWEASTDNVGVKAYEVYKDGVLITSTDKNTLKITGLVPLTAYSFTIRAKDETGNISAQSNQVSITTDPDTDAPSDPTGLSSPSKTDLSITVSWTAAVDNVGVTGYDVYMNGVLAGATTELSYTAGNLERETAYSFYIKAKDAAGNVSGASEALSVTTNPDKDAPTAPAGLTLAGKTDTTARLTWGASTDNVGVTGYIIYSGTTQVGSTTNETSYTVTGLSPDTAYSFTVKAVDAKNNISPVSNTVSVTTYKAAAPIPGQIEAESYIDMSGIKTGTASDGSTYVGWTDVGDWMDYYIDVPEAGKYDIDLRVAVGSTTAKMELKQGDTVLLSTPLESSGGWQNWKNVRYTLNLSTGKQSIRIYLNGININWFRLGPPDTIVPSAPTGLTVTAKTSKTIDISWNAATDNLSVAGYEIYKDGVLAGTTENTSYQLTGLVPETTYSLTVKAKDGAGNLSETSNTVSVTTEQAPATALPAGWGSSDVGAVATVGSSVYSNGTYTIKGSGADIWGTADEFQFAYTEVTGDCTITARVVSVQNTHSWARAGIMIRETLNTNSKHGMIGVNANTGTIQFQKRTTTGAISSQESVAAVAPQYVKLVRSGNQFTAYCSTDGETWKQIGTTQTIDMNSKVYVGLAVTSHKDGTVCTTVIDNVSVTKP